MYITHFYLFYSIFIIGHIKYIYNIMHLLIKINNWYSNLNIYLILNKNIYNVLLGSLSCVISIFHGFKNWHKSAFPQMTDECKGRYVYLPKYITSVPKLRLLSKDAWQPQRKKVHTQL